MNVTIKEIQETVRNLGKKIAAPPSLLIVRESPAADGAPYIEIKEGDLFLVSSERGVEFSRKCTSSKDELVFWLMSGVTSQMATQYELCNREIGRDSRRVYFATWVALLGRIDLAWGKRAGVEVDKILKVSPYKDN